MTDKKIYGKRNCPLCKTEIKYTSRSGYYYAKKNNTVCKRCGYDKMIGRKKKFTEEHKINLSISHKNSKIFQDVMKSDEYRDKIRKSMLGKKHSEETKKKISNSNKGKIITEKTRLKISENTKKAMNNDFVRKKMINSSNQKNWNEIIEKINQTNLKKYGHEFFNYEKNKEINLKKYGVPFYTQSNNYKLKRKKLFYEKLFDSDRLKSLTTPMFTLNEYYGVEKIINNKKVLLKYKFKCNKCGNQFLDTLADGNIPRCKICFPIFGNHSNIELDMLNFLKDDLNIKNIMRNNRKIITPYELDIYIPEKKIAIELNGNYWHSELNGKDKKYHLNKTKLCENKGIQLIHIFEDEWIYKKEIVKNRLKHILNKSENKIYARKCKLKKITYEVADKFLTNNHIQGSIKSNIRYGAFYKNKLIGVMTFSKKRIATGNINKMAEFELTRFCTSDNVIGLPSKFLSLFIKEYNPIKILSYADRRWSVGKMYEKIGFKKIKETQPNYWYMKNYNNRIHRYNFRKNLLNKKLVKYDSDLTEWENMQINGYDRIWDCGSLKYEMEFK